MSGEWRDATLDDLAADAVAALDLLRARPGVRPEAVGLLATARAAGSCCARPPPSGTARPGASTGFATAAGGSGRHPRATLRTEVFPGADHRIRTAHGTRPAPGYFTALTHRIRGHAVNHPLA